MLKKCTICGSNIRPDRKSGHYWCIKCKKVMEDYNLKYKICILGKNTGKIVGENNFIRRLEEVWKNMGHEVIGIHFGELYDYIPIYDITECFVNKKKIPLKFIEHIHNPDFIMVEQTYNRYDVSGIKCPVIYQHREYTHFPDIENPDILFGSYPNRLESFEFYHPNQYSKIPYCDTNYVGVKPSLFDHECEKIIKGITMIGWALNPYDFVTANGIWAKMVIEDQVGFYQECIKKGYVTYINGKKFKQYKEILEKCEAVLIDGGNVNGFGRRLFEAMASKTLCVIRVHNTETKKMYDEMGLTKDMCYFIYEPDDIKAVYEDWSITSKIDKAYDWMLKNHTYEVRAKEVLDKFEEFKSGIKKTKKTMGYAIHSDIKINNGKLSYDDLR